MNMAGYKRTLIIDKLLVDKRTLANESISALLLSQVRQEGKLFGGIYDPCQFLSYKATVLGEMWYTGKSDMYLSLLNTKGKTSIMASS